MSHSSGYLQDLSQLIEDCLLPIGQTEPALIDDSIPGSSAHLASNTLSDLLLLDGPSAEPPLSIRPSELPTTCEYENRQVLNLNLNLSASQLAGGPKLALGELEARSPCSLDISELIDGSPFVPERVEVNSNYNLASITDSRFTKDRNYSLDLSQLNGHSQLAPRSVSTRTTPCIHFSGIIDNSQFLPGTVKNKPIFTIEDISPISSTVPKSWPIFLSKHPLVKQESNGNTESGCLQQERLSHKAVLTQTLSTNVSLSGPQFLSERYTSAVESPKIEPSNMQTSVSPQPPTPASPQPMAPISSQPMIFAPTPTLPSRTEADVIAELRSNHEIAKHILVKHHRPSIASSRSSSIALPEYDLTSTPWTRGTQPAEGENGDEPDEKSEDERQPDSKPRKTTERKRRQNAAAERFIQERNEKKLKDGSKKVRPEDEEKQSARWLVNQSENRQIISSPREYQTELYERAKERNIIAVLDTGSGKTLIAVLLLRHIFGQELEDRAIGKTHRVSFFLVDSVQLVFQQHAVLKANLDQPMDMFCGEMNCDLWKNDIWEKHFANNMVIVCTAEVLRRCLHYNFIGMDRINLLIFDEAHHAKKDHSYARIVKDFYIPYKQSKDAVPPKIFGMTASPVDARTDVRKAAAELEGLLDSQIATANIKLNAEAMGLKEQRTSKEIIAKYGPLCARFETPLYRQMHERFKSSVVLNKPLLFAYDATRELGAWCADQVWLFCLTEEESKKLQARTERKYHARKVQEPLAVLEKRKTDIQEAQAIVKSHIFEPPDLDCNMLKGMSESKNLSSKVITLIAYLRDRYQRPTDDKCIVFVKQRYTARLLARLLSHPDVGTQHLIVGTLVGTKSGEAGDMNVSFREQVLTMMNFRKGTINCLVATSVAEEGLDVPDCNLIIRFDLYSTLIQYVQSRGRARHINSRYVHMLEKGNQEHLTILQEVKKNEGILQRFCEALPKDRLLSGEEFDIDRCLAKEKNRKYKTSGGALLDYKMSLTILANFVDSLPRSQDEALKADYIVQIQNKQFVCEVVLPEASPIRGAIGRPATTKQVAKCSAAFDACLLLIKGKHLDTSLLPTITKQLPIMNNARLAVDEKKKEAYEMRTKPVLWAQGGTPEELFVTVLILSNPKAMGRPSQPLALLTRSQISKLPSFFLHFGNNQHSPVQCISIAQPLRVSSEIIAQVNRFTLCIFDDVFSKGYESDPAKMPYFIVPAIGCPASDAIDPASIISWDIVKSVFDYETRWGFNHWENKCWQTEPAEFFNDKFIVDPYDGSRKMWSKGVTNAYKPLDAVPPNTAPRKGTRKNNNNILEYSCSLWKSARERATFDENQRVFAAQVISLRRNLLDEFDTLVEKTATDCFIVLEPLKVSALPTTVVAMALVFPAIIHRVESYLIALEACDLVHLKIRPDLALEAVTKDSDNSNEHGTEQVNFQRGMGKNYERLEFLGDCFLKMATSISIYGIHANSSEGDFHVLRMCMICNKNLKNNAIKLKLYEYIRSSAFSRRAWYPEGLVLKKGKTATAPNTHKLGDKTIADVCEALIGAALLTCQETKDLDNAVRAVTELVANENHQVACYSDYYTKLYKKAKYQLAPATEMQRDLAAQLERKHSYHFKYPRLARSAFTHPSYPFSYEQVPSYQRLEFLGDSLLDMVCVNFLFHTFPDKDPQWLTEHKMAMVSNQFLAALCVALDFHTHLHTMHSEVVTQVATYAMEIKDARRDAEADAVRAGKSPDDYSRDYWLQARQPPKCLGDIIEAYIGAIFVDSEYNYSEVERFFDANIKWYFTDMTIYDTYANKHPTTFLTKFLQVNMGCANWTLLTKEIKSAHGAKSVVVAMVVVHDQVITSWEAESSRYAKVGAAKKAVDLLEGMSPTEYQEKYKCDCIPEDVDDNDGVPGTAI